jgi:hypothetical protein
VAELEARAGALVNEALANWSESVKRVHWQDMKQTAMLTFLEHQDKPAAYGYTAVQTALKNYKWVHIRGLNGGWKSLACRDFAVLEDPLETDGDRFDSPRDNVYWRWSPAREWEIVPRPVEWQVIRQLDHTHPLTTEAVCREILTILAGMSNSNWYPEQLYRAAIIIAMLLTGYTWEDVEVQTDMDYRQVWDIWWHYRKTRLAPYLELTPMHQELIKLCGGLRLCYFEELTAYWLNQAQRKMVVLPQGIYTITYKRRGRRYGQAVDQMEASLQKGFSINGKPVVRAVSLGAVGGITKERLLTSSHQLESKIAQLGSRQPVQA